MLKDSGLAWAVGEIPCIVAVALSCSLVEGARSGRG